MPRRSDIIQTESDNIHSTLAAAERDYAAVEWGQVSLVSVGEHGQGVEQIVDCVRLWGAPKDHHEGHSVG